MPLPDLALINARARAGFRRRPFWQARYHDGRVISEWDIDWSLLPRKGLIELRLVCPNGDVAAIGNTVDASDRLFQFKSAVMLAGTGRWTDAYVIGLIGDTEGNCDCAAWEPLEARLVTFKDNVWDMRYRNVGRLAFEHLGIKPD